MIVTGATGFLGSQLVRQLRKEYRIFALGRRPLSEAGIPEGAGVHGFRVDIARRDDLAAVFQTIRELGGAELLLHMAAYYDFTGEENDEYRRTNVEGTRNLLELAEPLGLRRFIYTSSVAACEFPPPGATVTEASPPDAEVAYARSKRACEEMMREAAGRVPTCIVRPAAVVSEWCEYQPLDEFLRTWCSRRWNARVLGGRGLWAIPYLHVEDLLSFFLRVVEKVDELLPAEVLLASPDGATTQLDLFREATRCWFGAERRPVGVPRPLAAAGLWAREALGRVTGRMPFERAWMAGYIDRQLSVDASRTRRRLDWAPNPGRSVLAALPAMVANLRDHPAEWARVSALRRKVPARAAPGR